MVKMGGQKLNIGGNWTLTGPYLQHWFIDELDKQRIIKKLLKWVNKKQNHFNIYNVAFLKKI